MQPGGLQDLGRFLSCSWSVLPSSKACSSRATPGCRIAAVVVLTCEGLVVKVDTVAVLECLQQLGDGELDRLPPGPCENDDE